MYAWKVVPKNKNLFCTNYLSWTRICWCIVVGCLCTHYHLVVGVYAYGSSKHWWMIPTLNSKKIASKLWRKSRKIFKLRNKRSRFCTSCPPSVGRFMSKWFQNKIINSKYIWFVSANQGCENKSLCVIVGMISIELLLRILMETICAFHVW